MPKAKGKSRARRVGRRIKRAARRAKRSIALVPAFLGGAAALIPFVRTAPGRQASVMETVQQAIKTADVSLLTYIPGQFVDAVESSAFEMVGLGLAAAATAYLGTKLAKGKAHITQNIKVI